MVVLAMKCGVSWVLAGAPGERRRRVKVRGGRVDSGQGLGAVGAASGHPVRLAPGRMEWQEDATVAAHVFGAPSKGVMDPFCGNSIEQCTVVWWPPCGVCVWGLGSGMWRWRWDEGAHGVWVCVARGTGAG